MNTDKGKNKDESSSTSDSFRGGGDMIAKGGGDVISKDTTQPASSEPGGDVQNNETARTPVTPD